MSGQKSVNTLLAAGRYYFSGRTTFLELSIFFLTMWLIFGFDSGVAGSFGNEPIGMGFHWSMLAQMTLTIYILMVNFHVNGLTSFKQFASELKRDLSHIFRWSKKHVKQGKIEYLTINSYMGSFRALFLSVCTAFIGLFTFEIFWSIFYNYFQFGDIWFPIYYFSGTGIGMWRNFAILFLCIYCYIIAVRFLPPNAIIRTYWVMKNIVKGPYNGIYVNNIMRVPNTYKLKHNIKYGSLYLLLGFLAFGIWINTPQDPNLIKYYDTSSDITEQDGIIFAIRDKFPQTIYTYYDSSYLENYNVGNIGSYWVDDWYIHFLNIFTKTLFFMGVGGFIMVKVSKNE